MEALPTDMTTRKATKKILSITKAINLFSASAWNKTQQNWLWYWSSFKRSFLPPLICSGQVRIRQVGGRHRLPCLGRSNLEGIQGHRRQRPLVGKTLSRHTWSAQGRIECRPVESLRSARCFHSRNWLFSSLEIMKIFWCKSNTWFRRLIRLIYLN